MVPSGKGSGGEVTIFSCSRQRHYKDCPQAPSLSVTRIEAAVREAIAQWAADINAAARDEARQAARRDSATAVADLEKQVEAHRRNLASMAARRAEDAALGGILGDEAWVTAARAARADLDAAVADLERVRRLDASHSPPDDAASLIPDLLGDWDDRPPHALNAVLRVLVRRVVVYRVAERQRDGNG